MTALDEIVEVFPGLRATAFTNVPHALPVLDTHFPRFPVLPGVLILDTLAQVAAVALGAVGEGQERWGLAEARRIRFRHYVTPGDRMETTVDIAEVTGDTALCTGTVRVDGRSVTTVRVLRMARRAPQDAPAASEGTPA
ncbi:3-hydroxyacyl-ACP dehydratase FabZ family protein [Streptomyces sp. MCAF7]